MLPLIRPMDGIVGDHEVDAVNPLEVLTTLMLGGRAKCVSAPPCTSALRAGSDMFNISPSRGVLAIRACRAARVGHRDHAAAAHQ